MKSLKITVIIKENRKILTSFIFTLFFLALIIWFVKHEQGEVSKVKMTLLDARWDWITLGVVLGVIYIFIHGMMYCASFASIGATISIKDGTLLYLKRNFVSVFLPAGGVTSLAFFSKDIENKGIPKSQINFASTIYGFIGILSVIIFAIPVFIYSIVKGTIGYGEWMGVVIGLLILGSLYYFYLSIVNDGKFYKLIVRYFPIIDVYSQNLRNNTIIKKQFLFALFYSIIIELIGMIHIYIAMLALNIAPSISAAVIAYVISVVFMVISPFLRGLGAVETSMTFIFIKLGYTPVEAVSVTVIYRFLEFWLQLVLGAFSFLIKINKLLLRVIPAVLLLAMGIINIISVLTPAIQSRLSFLENFLPLEAINASNYLVFTAGLFLLITAAFMLKGLRMAWYFAIALCLFSFLGNLTKAIDYEEAVFSLLVLIVLFLSRKEYYIRNSRKLSLIGVKSTLIGIAGILIYGVLGFYYLDFKHFHIDFNLSQSIKYTLQNFILVGSDDLIPLDRFARNFIHSINISGFIALSFLTYTLIRPYIHTDSKDDIAELDAAKSLLLKYGTSSLDYFKTYGDKLIFKIKDLEGFISYRIAGNFAVVLEDPVCADINFTNFIEQFDDYCYERGLKCIYYRVPEENLERYHSLKKKSLFMGQEAVLDLESFTLEGGSKKSIRNAIKKVVETGINAKIYEGPISDGLLQKLKSVSDEWLKATGREEIIFSQGVFLAEELKNQTIITVENKEEKVIAFLNIIADYAKGEGTYDLIRKTEDAPNGIIDFILIEMFHYFKEKGYQSVNLGFSALSGIDHAKNFPERSMKFAYDKIQSFSHYKGLRNSKEKFSPVWKNKYLIYDQDYDLLKIPIVLNKVIKYKS